MNVAFVDPLVTGQTPAAPPVPFYTRVVAAGTSEDGKRLRATVLITPSPTEATPAASLGSWTKQMMDHLVSAKWKIPLRIVPAVYSGAAPVGVPDPMNKDAQECGKPFLAEANALSKAWDNAKDDDHSGLLKLWQDTFASSDKNYLWPELSACLRASLAGQTYGPGDIKNDKADPKTQGEETELGDRGEMIVGVNPTTDAAKTIESVIAVQHGDLALGLEFKRVRELCASLAEADGDAGARARLQQEIWTNDLILQTFKSKAAPQSDKTVDQKIKEAKQAEHKELSDKLNTSREAARAAYKTSTACLTSATCGPTVVPGPANSSKPAEIVVAKAADIDRKIDTALASHAIGSWAQYQRQPQEGGQKTINETNERKERAGRNFFALQSSPSLSRLFFLAIDVEFDVSKLNEVIANCSKVDATPAGDANTRYFFIATSFGSSDAAGASALGLPATWTIAKHVGPVKKPGYFWPASAAEVNLGPKSKTDSSNVAQYGGRLVLGTGCNSENCQEHHPRFDVSSLDVRSATEMERQNRQNREAYIADQLQRAPLGVCSVVEVPEDASAKNTFMTAGLTLIDKGRQAHAVRQLASRQAKDLSKNYVVLDAEDLTIGYRLDVAIPTSEGYRWRSLMNRYVEYGTSGASGRLVRRILDNLVGTPGSARRAGLESAMISFPGRYVPKGKPENTDPDKPKVTRKVEAFVEETVALWDGGPMAVDCSGSRSRKMPKSGVAIEPEIANALPIGQRLSLPDSSSDGDLCPPPLRYGWPYRFGMRAVYMGGGSVGVIEGEGYEGLGGSLAFPPAVIKADAGEDGKKGDKKRTSAAEQVRFLRHHRIDAPFLLLPSGQALRPNWPMGYEQAAAAIVRTVKLSPQDTLTEEGKSALERGKPQMAQRIFMAPAINREDVARHGSFDSEQDRKSRHPQGGLRKAHYDAEKGGFRSVVTTTSRGIDGKRFPESRRISTASGLNDSDFSARGDLVFESGEDGSGREEEYYPDPCASLYAIGVRNSATGRFLGGKPVVLGTVMPGKGYPDIMPLVVTLKAVDGARRGARELSIQDIVTPIAEPGLIDPSDLTDVAGKGSVLAQQVVARLYPGEDFELFVWCVPSAKRLAHTFALIQALGTVAAHCEPAAKGSIEEKAQENLGPLIRATFAEEVKAALEKDKGGANGSGYIGPGGLPSPNGRFLRALAGVVHGKMQARPIEEIAAARVLRLTHAVNLPASAPEIPAQPRPGGKSNGSALFVVRPSSKRLQDARNEQFDETRLFTREDSIDGGASDFAICGEVKIDLETSDSFELVAETCFPRNTVFDDRNRGRDLFSRRTDLWPRKISEAGDLAFRTPEDVFGFEVDANGFVALPRSRVTLLRVEGLRKPEPNGLPLDTINLGRFYTVTPKEEKYCSVSHPHAFPDGKARRLTFKVVSGSRTAALLETSNRLETLNGQVWQKPGEPIDRKYQTRESNTVDVFLPATFRPAICEAAAPFPIFSWKRDEVQQGPPRVYSITRETSVRIPLAREWFSSGEDEKVGIVVWPPDLFEEKTGSLQDQKVHINSRLSQPRTVYLYDFEDDNLGPGGKFVTRWGGDPIREATHDLGRFIPKTAFADQDVSIGGRKIATHYSNVLMPVGDDAGGQEADKQKPANGKEQAVRTMMTVGLMAYEPRFDLECEEWFIDVTLTPGTTPDAFVRFGLVRFQPHTKPDLQLSFPVTQWAQILPRRTVSVTVDKVNDSILVNVSGPGTAGTKPTSYGSSLTNELDGRSIMRAEFVHEYQTDAGWMRRRIGGPTESSPSSAEHSQRGWNCALKIPSAKETAAFGPGKFFVFVSEIERRRPATYSVEPLPLGQVQLPSDVAEAEEEARRTGASSNDVDRLVESGPRFSARIEIDLD